MALGRTLTSGEPAASSGQGSPKEKAGPERGLFLLSLSSERPGNSEGERIAAAPTPTHTPQHPQHPKPAARRSDRGSWAQRAGPGLGHSSCPLRLRDPGRPCAGAPLQVTGDLQPATSLRPGPLLLRGPGALSAATQGAVRPGVPQSAAGRATHPGVHSPHGSLSCSPDAAHARPARAEGNSAAADSESGHFPQVP